MTFEVVDLTTGTAPNLGKIALNEAWAYRLVYLNMEGFAICQDGRLILMDTCGNYVEVPVGRFKVVTEP